MTTLDDILATFSPEHRAEVEARARELIERERRRVYFRAGEVMTCENGHPIADIVEDADRRQTPSVDQFAEWRNVERAPEKGEQVMAQDWRCTACGGRFCLTDGIGGFIIHIGLKWRTGDAGRWGLSSDDIGGLD